MVNSVYPKKAYICLFNHYVNGKPLGLLPEPEILNSLEAIKETIQDFNKEMSRRESTDFIDETACIFELTLIKQIPFSFNRLKVGTKQKWTHILWQMLSILLNLDNDTYRVLIAPWEDDNGKLWNSVLSLYQSSKETINWNGLDYSDKRIGKKTRYIGLYRLGPPQAYNTKLELIGYMPPKGQEQHIIPRKVQK